MVHSDSGRGIVIGRLLLLGDQRGSLWRADRRRLTTEVD